MVLITLLTHSLTHSLTGRSLRYKTNSIHRQFDAKTTEELKSICCENGIKRSGAKYEITAAILAHVQGHLLTYLHTHSFTHSRMRSLGYLKQQENKKLVEADGLAAKYRLEIRKIDKFEKIEKHISKLRSTIFSQGFATHALTHSRTHSLTHLHFRRKKFG